ncbi:MAG: RNA polymerase sigma factor [Myxococcota bacterium]
MAPPSPKGNDRQTEIDLADRAQRGDGDAQSQLVHRLLPHLRQVAHALLGRTADADDAVQIALMRVLEGLPTWRADAALHHWARRVAATTCLRMREQNNRRSRRISGDADVEAVVAPAPACAPDGRDVGRSARDYLDQLPAVQRQVVLLRHALGYSVDEIAEITEVPEGTVKSRLLYGRRTLRKLARRDQNLDGMAGGTRRATP